MNYCHVYIDNEEKMYDGQYEITEDGLEVEINHHSSFGMDGLSVGNEINYHTIKIEDRRNKAFYYSTSFLYAGVTWSLTQYEKYRTNFYFFTEDIEAANEFDSVNNISVIKTYNPILGQILTNPALQIKYSEGKTEYIVNTTPDVYSLELHHNNIVKIDFSADYSCTCTDYNHNVTINSEHYARIILEHPIDTDDIISYVNEFDVIIGAYTLKPVRSYETYITAVNGHSYKVVHKLLAKKGIYKKTIWNPVKEKFYDFVEKMYRSINYREMENRNKVILLDFKKPASLEDEYTYYFRFIDLYMGQKLKTEGENCSNYDRISTFVDAHLSYFGNGLYDDVDKLKNELNSLRNHFVHEGYYFPNNQFEVTSKKKFLYMKDMDYKWLYEIVKVFKLCSYITLYREVLGVDINEQEFRNVLKC